MATYICSQLMDKLNNFHRLHDRPYKTPVVATHTNLGRAAKCSPDSNRTGAVKIAFSIFECHAILKFAHGFFCFLTHCGFQKTLT